MAAKERRTGNLTDSFIASSDIVFDLFCEVCADDDKHLEANGFCVECVDYLCEDCINAHGITRTTKNHTIQAGIHMPQQKPSSISAQPTTPMTGTCTEKCDRHPNRPVEYFCQDDGSLACTVCLVNHRQCGEVAHISDISKHLPDSEEYKQLTDDLKTLQKQSKAVIKIAEENSTEADEICTDVDVALQELRGKMIKAFDTFECDIKKKALIIKSEDKKKLKSISVQGASVLAELDEISSNLHSLESNHQLDQLCVRVIKLKDRVQTLHDLLDEAEVNNKVTEYKFEPRHIQDILDDPASIGTLSEQALGTPRASPGRMQSSQQNYTDTTDTSPEDDSSSATSPVDVNATFVNSIRVKTDSDRKDCAIGGCLCLPGNKMVISDYENSKLKLLNLQTSKVVAELKTSSKPWGVANIRTDQVAVTLPDDKKIIFVKVTSDLQVERKIKAGGKCSAILHSNGKLIIALCKPLKIERITLDGTVEMTIECSHSFKFLSHMALSPGHDAIYVSDDERNSVVKLSMSGIVEAEYQDGQLRSPRGVVVDQQGRVIVCGEESGNIHMLTSDLTKMKVLVDKQHIYYTAVSLSHCQRTCGYYMYIGTLDNCVRKFQLT